MSEQTAMIVSDGQLIDRFLVQLVRQRPVVKCNDGQAFTIENLTHSYVGISGQAEAGAADVAAEVSRTLNWPLFTRQQLELIALNDDDRARLRECLDKPTARAVADGLAKLEGVNAHGRAMAEVMLCLATRYEVVLLNCGATLVLPRSPGVDVRLIASESLRAGRLAEIGDIDLTLAYEQVHWIDTERREFIQMQFGADVDTLDHYDLVADSERVAVSQIVQQVIHALEAKRTYSPHRCTA